MPIAIRIGGNRSISITARTTSEALASTPMKVKSAIRKRIKVMGYPLVVAISVHARDIAAAPCWIDLPSAFLGHPTLQMLLFCQRYTALIAYDYMIHYVGTNHVEGIFEGCVQCAVCWTGNRVTVGKVMH